MVFFLEDEKTKKPDVLVVDLTSSPVQNLGFPVKAQLQKDARVRVAAEVSSAKKMAIFGRSYTDNSKTLNLTESLIDGKATAFNDSSSYETSAESFIAETDQWSYFHQVFERIDQQLMFDSLLAQYNHFGYVYVEFEVGPNGRFV
ncbi:MAG: hypothetical protein ACKOX6_12855, partial [Bdellovibrio sp.]